MLFRGLAFGFIVLQALHLRGLTAVETNSQIMDSVKQMVQDKIKENKVMVFSKSYCPYCKKAKNILDKYNMNSDNYQVMELDQMADQDQARLIQDLMKTLTGASSVPRVFINGKCIGGGDDTEKLERSGELKKLLLNSGAIHEEL